MKENRLFLYGVKYINSNKKKRHSLWKFMMSMLLGLILSLVVQISIMSRTPCQIFYSFYKAAKSIPYPPSEKSANLDIHRRDDEQHRLDQNLPSLDGVGKEFEDIYSTSI
ncbi:unnamed protein product [Gordionus sp. m RMFG-2023]